MSTLVMERSFSAEPELVFAFLTRPEHLIRWWGHEGFTITEHRLDFSRTGACVSVFVNADGGTHKVSGEVKTSRTSARIIWRRTRHGKHDARTSSFRRPARTERSGPWKN